MDALPDSAPLGTAAPAGAGGSALFSPGPAGVTPGAAPAPREVAAVRSLEKAGAGYRRLLLAAPAAAAAAVAGQFVHVRVPGLDPAAMRRPLSICDADAAAGTLEILFKVVGRGTEALAALAPGARLDLLGPLGRGFPPPPAGALPLYVGGGYGVAPLHFLARTLRRGVLFVGGRTAADVLLADRFAALGIEVRAATNDGSLGMRGLVTAPLDAWIAESNGPFVLYACGPAPMLRAVDERALELGAPAFLSLDRRMLCGVGACLGCTQTVRTAAGTATARVCADGPVFRQGQIVWE